MIRRAALLWLVLLGVYASTIGIDAFGRSGYGGDEPHQLLTALSIVEDGKPDLLDEYRARDYRSFYPYTLEARGALTSGNLHEPHGVGFPLVIAPAWAIGEARAVELLLAAIAALAVALGYLLALRAVPDPWALGAAVAVGLSPPLLAYSTSATPELTAAALLAGTALLALRMDEHPSRAAAFGCFFLLGVVPWLGMSFTPAALVVGAVALRALRRAQRPWVTLVSLEIAAVSVAVFLSVNDNLYGGPTPHSADLGGASGTDASSAGDYLERTYRLAALLIDREAGLLRWAPVLALALLGAWLLLRERRGRLARAIPALRREERTATVCATAAGAQLLTAAFLAPTMFGFAFPGRHLMAALPLCVPLVALGLRRVPRLGAALGLVTLAGSVWVYVALRFGGGAWIDDRPDAPFGPLTDALPLFERGAGGAFAVAAGLGVAACAALALALRGPRWRALRGSVP